MNDTIIIIAISGIGAIALTYVIFKLIKIMLKKLIPEPENLMEEPKEIMEVHVDDSQGNGKVKQTSL